MKYLILLVFLLTNSCLIVDKAGKGHGKILANSVKANTEGVPGILNAVILAATIAINIVEYNKNENYYKTTKKFIPNGLNNANFKKINYYNTTKKFVPTNANTSNPHIVEEKIASTQEDNKKIKSYVKLSEW